VSGMIQRRVFLASQRACEIITSSPATTDDAVVVYVQDVESTCIPWEIVSPTALTPSETRQMFPAMPDKRPLNRAERRALKLKRGGKQ
jgi:hypothetical protein